MGCITKVYPRRRRQNVHATLLTLKEPLRVASDSERLLPSIVNAQGVTCNAAWKRNALSMRHHPLTRISQD